jgi:hypothetical protein
LKANDPENAAGALADAMTALNVGRSNIALLNGQPENVVLGVDASTVDEVVKVCYLSIN